MSDLPKIDGKTPWEFACGWYTEGEVHRLLARDLRGLPNDGTLQMMPRDIRGYEFAAWLTDQYRLAMRKGIELGMEAAEKSAAEKTE